MKRAIVIGLIAAAPLGACGSDGMANGRGSGPAGTGSYQDPSSNPQEALPNPQEALPNTSAPSANEQAPLPNPEQPVPPGGPGAGVPNDCTSICVGTGICSGACQAQCAANGGVVGQCASAIAEFIQCAGSVGLGLVCSDRGSLDLPNVMNCRDEGRAVVECLGFNDRPPDNSGPDNADNRGPGRRNDAGLPTP
jgi:hypothetical protein